MTARMVTYRVKDGRADENAAYVRDVMADLEARKTVGVTYSVYLLDDGLTFLHVADEEGDGGAVQVSEAFQRFTATLLEDRCAATPELHTDDPGGEVRRVSRASEEFAQEGFAEQVAPLRPGLLLHCYRMLGSSHDAEDAVQETLLRGWRGVDRFEGRSSLRTWLYTVATNVCLREIERRGRRLVPVDLGPAADPADGLAAPLTETVWLGPLPDAGITWESSPADAVYEQREAVELGFIAALQHLPALQRAVLVLRDVLAFSAVETAEILDTTVPSVTSALARARGTVRSRTPRPQPAGGAARGGRPPGARHGRGVHRGLGAERRDAVVALLAEDVEMSMPPYAEWYRGRAAVAALPHRDPAPPRSALAAGADDGQRSAGAGVHRLERADRGLPHPRPVGAHLRARRHHGVHHLPRPGGGAR